MFLVLGVFSAPAGSNGAGDPLIWLEERPEEERVVLHLSGPEQTVIPACSGGALSLLLLDRHGARPAATADPPAPGSPLESAEWSTTPSGDRLELRLRPPYRFQSVGPGNGVVDISYGQTAPGCTGPQRPFQISRGTAAPAVPPSSPEPKRPEVDPESEPDPTDGGASSPPESGIEPESIESAEEEPVDEATNGDSLLPPGWGLVALERGLELRLVPLELVQSLDPLPDRIREPYLLFAVVARVAKNSMHVFRFRQREDRFRFLLNDGRRIGNLDLQSNEDLVRLSTGDRAALFGVLDLLPGSMHGGVVAFPRSFALADIQEAEVRIHDEFLSMPALGEAQSSRPSPISQPETAQSSAGSKTR